MWAEAWSPGGTLTVTPLPGLGAGWGPPDRGEDAGRGRALVCRLSDPDRDWGLRRSGAGWGGAGKARPHLAPGLGVNRDTRGDTPELVRLPRAWGWSPPRLPPCPARLALGAGGAGPG